MESGGGDRREGGVSGVGSPRTPIIVVEQDDLTLLEYLNDEVELPNRGLEVDLDLDINYGEVQAPDVLAPAEAVAPDVVIYHSVKSAGREARTRNRLVRTIAPKVPIKKDMKQRAAAEKRKAKESATAGQPTDNLPVGPVPPVIPVDNNSNAPLSQSLPGNTRSSGASPQLVPGEATRVEKVSDDAVASTSRTRSPSVPRNKQHPPVQSGSSTSTRRPLPPDSSHNPSSTPPKKTEELVMFRILRQNIP